MRFLQPVSVDVQNAGSHPTAFPAILNGYAQFQKPISDLHKAQ